MRSRAEWALRAAALAALVLLIWRAVAPAEPAAAVAAARGGLDRTLVFVTRRPVTALALDLDTAPGPLQRAWLGAIRGAGTNVAWSGERLTPIALATMPVVEPEHRVRVAVGGPDGATVVLADEIGPIDTLRIRATGSSMVLRTATGAVSASARGSRAVAELPPQATVRRVFVVGTAGWESKFVIVALEEAGWQVDARLRVAPGIEVRQGSELTLDTARHSAVISLDAAAAIMASAIGRFVSSGGGAIFAGAATRLPAFAQITPAATGPRRVAEPRPALVLGGLKSDAMVLESRGAAAPLVAARRSGRGRVVASGYDETWRWRMRRAAEAPAEHREWWTALVSAVANAPMSPARESGAATDPAPVAALSAALGPPSALSRQALGSGSWLPPTWLLFGVFLASILGEVVSRRWRGVV